MEFKILKRDKNSKARNGVIKLLHGEILTPCFMPCATHGAVKTLSPLELEEIGVQILLSNTYHLYLRPGAEKIRFLGGLHSFMRWEKPILTDSGGYQVFSLAKEKGKKLVKIKEDGIEFRSHLDGSIHFFSPKKTIDIQLKLGSDLLMVLDECVPYPVSKIYAKLALERTNRWAKESLDYFNLKTSKLKSKPALFGIIQGSVYKDLRKKAVEFITSLGFDGIAIGGLSVGEGKRKMYKVLDWVMEELKDFSKPVYLMGVGAPEDILEAVDKGIDMFDCVLPTRLARNGAVWNERGRINLFNAKYKKDKRPIMENCDCYTCRNKFSKAYLRHLLIENEVLGIRLTTIHNLRFIIRLMEKIREAIKEDKFKNLKQKFLKNWKKM